MTMNSGAYRCVSYEDAVKLQAAGEKVEWAEGCGYIVYDQIALDKFKHESEVARQHSEWARSTTIPAARFQSSGEANNCEQEEGA